jgi:hypothetical protein
VAEIVLVDDQTVGRDAPTVSSNKASPLVVSVTARVAAAGWRRGACTPPSRVRFAAVDASGIVVGPVLSDEDVVGPQRQMTSVPTRA